MADITIDINIISEKYQHPLVGIVIYVSINNIPININRNNGK